MVEIIGFIISLLALLYLFVSQNPAAQRQKAGSRDLNEDYSEKEKDEPFKDLMEAIEKEIKRTEKIPARMAASPQSLPQTLKKKLSQQNNKDYFLSNEPSSNLAMDNRHLKSSLENRHLSSPLFSHGDGGRKFTYSHDHGHSTESYGEGKKSKGLLMINRLTHPRDMIIYQEIIGKPIALRAYSKSSIE